MLITKKTFFGVETCCVWKWEWLLTNKNLITHFYWKTTQFLRCSLFKVSQSLTFSHELWDSESELFCVWNKSRDWCWAKSCYQEIFFIRMNSQQERRTFKQMFCLCAYLFFYVAKAAKTFPATQRSFKCPWRFKQKFIPLTLPFHTSLLWTAIADGVKRAMRSLIANEFLDNDRKAVNAILGTISSQLSEEV